MDAVNSATNSETVAIRVPPETVLPDELMKRILSFLPDAVLPVVMVISKKWGSLVLEHVKGRELGFLKFFTQSIMNAPERPLSQTEKAALVQISLEPYRKNLSSLPLIQSSLAPYKKDIIGSLDRLSNGDFATVVEQLEGHPSRFSQEMLESVQQLDEDCEALEALFEPKPEEEQVVQSHKIKVALKGLINKNWVERAINMALAIPVRWMRDSALDMLSETLVNLNDTDRALRAANHISDDEIKAVALTTVHKKLLSTEGLDAALHSLEPITSAEIKDEILQAMTSELIGENKIQGALDCIDVISDPNARDQALLGLSNRLHKLGRILESSAIAQQIKADDLRLTAQCMKE